jgi:predicted naringenin-chalcone synthase
MSFSILGLGTALPEHTLSQTEAERLALEICRPTEPQSRLLRRLYRRSGVEQRHTVLPHRAALQWVDPDDPIPCHGPTTGQRMQYYQQHALPLALRASRDALLEADLPPRQVTHLITVTCTGFMAPGVDLGLIGQLGLSPTTERIQIGFMGCQGAINGLRTARAIAAENPAARVLLCAVELCSLHYRFRWTPETFVGNALFADGAAALAGGAREGPRFNDSSASAAAPSSRRCPTGDTPVPLDQASHPYDTAHQPLPDAALVRPDLIPPRPPKDRPGCWRVLATGSCLLPDSRDAMTWRIGDYGFEMTLSARVPELIAEHLRPWLESWLDGHGRSLGEVGSWAVHPGGPRILEAVEAGLVLDPQALAASREVLSSCGNMSSPTVLFVLDRLRRQSAPLPCVALAFGPGLTAEAALVER